MDNKPSRRGFFKLGAGGVLAGMAGATALGQGAPAKMSKRNVIPCKANPSGNPRTDIAATYMAYKHTDPLWMDVCTAKNRPGRPPAIALYLDADGWYDIIAYAPDHRPDIQTVRIFNGELESGGPGLRFNLTPLGQGQRVATTPASPPVEVTWQKGSSPADASYRIFGPDRAAGLVGAESAELTYNGNYYMYCFKNGYKGTVKPFEIEPRDQSPKSLGAITLQPV